MPRTLTAPAGSIPIGTGSIGTTTSEHALNDLSEEELVRLSVEGDALATHELLRRFESYAVAIASRRPIPGIPREDAAQEFLITIHHAIGTFDPLRGAPFSAWAGLAVNTRITDLLRSQGRDKRITLDRAESFDASLRQAEEGGTGTLADVVAAPGDAYTEALSRVDMRAALPLSAAGGSLDDLLAFVDQEGLDAVVDAFYLEPVRAHRTAHLSRSETKVALAYIDRVPPAEIALQLRWTVKKVDNTWQRTSAKLAKVLRMRD